MGRLVSNQTMSASDAKKIYEIYATNIDIRHVKSTFNGVIGKMYDVHGDTKSVKSRFNVTIHTTTMHTSDGKFKVWVYRGKGEKFLQDHFEISEGTKEEMLKIMLERATGKDAAGNKIIFT
ncbi:hypothetical protein D6D02_05995 [Aureobasidium pullulans]|nr:hypothetical protein D6D02_05995 [Aureobasidium pullulans]